MSCNIATRPVPGKTHYHAFAKDARHPKQSTGDVTSGLTAKPRGRGTKETKRRSKINFNPKMNDEWLPARIFHAKSETSTACSSRREEAPSYLSPMQQGNMEPPRVGRYGGYEISRLVAPYSKFGSFGHRIIMISCRPPPHWNVERLRTVTRHKNFQHSFVRPRLTARPEMNFIGAEHVLLLAEMGSPARRTMKTILLPSPAGLLASALLAVILAGFASPVY